MMARNVILFFGRQLAGGFDRLFEEFDHGRQVSTANAGSAEVYASLQ
jgi:hypothetical protein